MIDGDHDLSITQQVKALGISRGSVYYLPRPVSPTSRSLRRMDELNLKFSFTGSRMLRDLLNREGTEIGSRPARDPDEADAHRDSIPEAEHVQAGPGQ